MAAQPSPQSPPTRPRLAVWKFASCDGCQLSLLDGAADLLALADAVEIAWFPEASSLLAGGRYDLSLVEGSVSTPDDVARLHDIRERSTLLVTIGACATAGGVQALRNAAAIDEVAASVYPHPEWIDALATSTPIADHVAVDAELRGCPIDKRALLEVVTAVLVGRRPQVPRFPVCVECKMAGTTCVLVAGGQSCLGPVTQAGCGALCPRFHRGCFGCFGPSETPNTAALADRLRDQGVAGTDLVRLFRQMTSQSPAFRAEADRHA